MSKYIEDSVARRDFRSAKGEPEIPPHRKKGSGGKICKKSKTGEPHDFSITNYSEHRDWGWFMCSRCGKKGKYWFHWN